KGAETSGVYQLATFEFDGYGRLWHRKAPDQTSQTVVAYNADGTTQSVTDARGITTNFSYNNRHLVTNVSYDRHSLASVPTEKAGGATGTTDVADTPAVTYQHDAVGNRTSMTTAGGAGRSCNHSYHAPPPLT